MLHYEDAVKTILDNVKTLGTAKKSLSSIGWAVCPLRMFILILIYANQPFPALTDRPQGLRISNEPLRTTLLFSASLQRHEPVAC